MTVINYLDNVPEWKPFVEGELSKSNKKNNKTLGGSSRPNDDDNQEDENEINYDVQMDKIMARFNSFNQIIQNPTPTDDDEDGDEDELTQDDQNSQMSRDNWDEDDDDSKGAASDATNASALSNTPNGGVTIQAVDLKPPSELDTEYVDNSYWKLTQPTKESDVDSLLAELEL